ncbi:hypothetical protein JDW19_02405 [Paenibacillus polymyxa]|uniref:Uncharacterized protein n=1 Tax=Paenibacillus polymyxa TaxID=1406 RepID=A0A8I1IX76_PAEPO|nr:MULTISPECIES: hypothetical protein [Paenibacillus]KAF6576574.1 hypothetical protein G9G53_01290 [Paenibacillus sp. EKM206P]KAF6591292.1 hypothetical protein G9G52_02675 [Paenibacillus sp. EKM205P]MBM0631980.1 hypothetical protein [Paenibacillus polymyxa]
MNHDLYRIANIPEDLWPLSRVVDGVIYTPTLEELLSNGFITQEEYDRQKSLFNTQPSEIELLREENTTLKLTLAELAETQEANKTETQSALAELAEMITGGA